MTARPSVPAGYRFYQPTVMSFSGQNPAGWQTPGLERAIAKFLFLSATIANYATHSFSFKSVTQARLGLPATLFTYYIAPAAVPAPPAIPINLAGLATIASISAATVIAVQSNGFFVDDFVGASPESWTVRQVLPGRLGNVGINVDAALAEEIQVNGRSVADFLPRFYNGQDVAIAALWGRNRAMLPSPAETSQGTEGE